MGPDARFERAEPEFELQLSLDRDLVCLLDPEGDLEVKSGIGCAFVLAETENDTLLFGADGDAFLDAWTACCPSHRGTASA